MWKLKNLIGYIAAMVLDHYLWEWSSSEMDSRLRDQVRGKINFLGFITRDIKRTIMENKNA